MISLLESRTAATQQGYKKSLEDKYRSPEKRERGCILDDSRCLKTDEMETGEKTGSEKKEEHQDSNARIHM